MPPWSAGRCCGWSRLARRCTSSTRRSASARDATRYATASLQLGRALPAAQEPRQRRRRENVFQLYEENIGADDAAGRRGAAGGGAALPATSGLRRRCARRPHRTSAHGATPRAFWNAGQRRDASVKRLDEILGKAIPPAPQLLRRYRELGGGLARRKRSETRRTFARCVTARGFVRRDCRWTTRSSARSCRASAPQSESDETRVHRLRALQQPGPADAPDLRQPHGAGPQHQPARPRAVPRPDRRRQSLRRSARGLAADPRAVAVRARRTSPRRSPTAASSAASRRCSSSCRTCSTTCAPPTTPTARWPTTCCWSR